MQMRPEHGPSGTDQGRGRDSTFYDGARLGWHGRCSLGLTEVRGGAMFIWVRSRCSSSIAIGGRGCDLVWCVKIWVRAELRFTSSGNQTSPELLMVRLNSYFSSL